MKKTFFVQCTKKLSDMGSRNPPPVEENTRLEPKVFFLVPPKCPWIVQWPPRAKGGGESHAKLWEMASLNTKKKQLCKERPWKLTSEGDPHIQKPTSRPASTAQPPSHSHHP